MSGISLEGRAVQQLYFPSRIKFPNSHVSPRSKGLIALRLLSQEFYFFEVHGNRARYEPGETDTIAVPFPQGEVEQPYINWVIFTIDGVGYSPDSNSNCFNYLEISFYAQGLTQERQDNLSDTYPPGLLEIKWYQSKPSDMPEPSELLDFPNTTPEGFKEVKPLKCIRIQLSSTIKDDEVWVGVDFVDTK
jgi:hypothetical protein